MFTRYNLFLLISSAILLFVISCNTNTIPQEGNTSHADSIGQTDSITNRNNSEDVSMLVPQYKTIGEFKIEYGYLKYDEEKYGFSNPGFMRVFKGDKLVFEDSFKGEGTLDIESLGIQELSGKKLVFKLNYGTHACDYTSYSRYYVSFNNKLFFLKESYASTGGDQYASQFYEHILPNDSAGVPNSILIVDGILFLEHDQPDQFDTTFITFEDFKFTISKPTNNLDKVK